MSADHSGTLVSLSPDLEANPSMMLAMTGCTVNDSLAERSADSLHTPRIMAPRGAILHVPIVSKVVARGTSATAIRDGRTTP